MKKFSKVSLLAFLLSISLFALFSCSTTSQVYHENMMKGLVLESSGNDLYLCIGSKDGAKVGDEFNVYKNKPLPKEKEQRKGQALYTKELTGVVKITEIVNEHYAKGVKVSGVADVNSVIEVK